MRELPLNKQELLARTQDFRIFRYLNDGEREHLLDLCTLHSYRDGETIITEGEVSPYLYIVVDGRVRILVQRDDGLEAHISDIEPGEVFGEAAVFSDTERTASVVSQGTSFLLALERKRLTDFLKNDLAGGQKVLLLIIYSLIHKLRGTNYELALERKASFNQPELDDLFNTYFDDKWHLD